ncbi:hypothetical protein HK098_000116 [Nowakowskiella sp. JEL0407]|nr:hypothetical protein HK098_000116 [Nowakowskiella sp. JEL0407]
MVGWSLLRMVGCLLVDLKWTGVPKRQTEKMLLLTQVLYHLRESKVFRVLECDANKDAIVAITNILKLSKSLRKLIIREQHEELVDQRVSEDFAGAVSINESLITLELCGDYDLFYSVLNRDSCNLPKLAVDNKGTFQDLFGMIMKVKVRREIAKIKEIRIRHLRSYYFEVLAVSLSSQVEIRLFPGIMAALPDKVLEQLLKNENKLFDRIVFEGMSSKELQILREDYPHIDAQIGK